ncbi:MAG: hypothetical protein ABIF04_07645 [Chloroflexota bacterium]
MKRAFLISFLIIINILAIGAFIVWFLNRNYPIIGHDYRLFMPYMIDSYLHQKVNGLTIQWYTPSFAGGRPVFPNPQDLQFSLPQFLMWIVNPWIAILGSMMIYISIGFIATYTFLKRFLGLHSFASILGAVFFIANGFYFQHMAAGHVTFQAFTLFPLIMIVIVHTKLPSWLGGLLLSLVIAILLYSGIHNVPFFLLTSILFFPILYLIKPSLLNWKRIFSIAIWGGISTALICGSKLSAILYFMRFFPRLAQDNYTTNLLTGTVGMVRQLLGTMTFTPIYRVLHMVSPSISTYQSVVDMAISTGTVYGYWELDASLSPALLLLLAGGAIAFLFRKPNLKPPFDKKRLIAIACLIIAIWLVIEFTLAKGIFYPYIRDLPIFASLRVNVRNVSAFIFPLAVVGAVIFDKWTRNWKSKTRLLVIFLLLDGIALGALLTYHWVPTEYAVVAGYRLNQCDFQPILATYNKIRYEGETFPIENVSPNTDPWLVFLDNATTLIDPYNTYFKDITRHLTDIQEGSVYDINNGYFNIVDPTSYIFPEVNQSKMYERIPVADKDKFLDFINRRQPNWKLPIVQQILNWTSVGTLVVVLCTLVAYFARHWVKRRTSKVVFR